MKRFLNLTASELRGIFLVVLGLCTLGYYYSWWFQAGRALTPWLLLTLIFAITYGIFQLGAGWFVYLGAHHRNRIKSGIPKNLTVDVFVTAYKEDAHMVKSSLTAACNMKGCHKTWLLDDGNDPALQKLAADVGAGYLTRFGNRDVKAGNVNEAFRRTEGDVVVIFDIDHIPHSEFLHQTLHCFDDPQVGFVQVMPTFYNNRSNGWVARAATETSLDFYNPTSLGMDAFHSATKMGTNSIIRRSALESIGGYQPGLAEDLATSIALHADGWRSRYVAEPLAPGLAPPDLASWFTQQLKWSRGVFEVLIATYPKLFSSLTWGQRLAYAVRTTKYWIGLVIFIHLATFIAILFSSDLQTKLNTQQYLWHLIPLVFADSLIRGLALRKWRHPLIASEPLWRAIMLIFATWPIYTMAWAMALIRQPLDFKPTPKKSAASVNRMWLLPQLASVALLLAGIFYSVSVAGADFRSFWLLYLASIGFAIPQIGLLRPLLRPIFVTAEQKENMNPVVKSKSEKMSVIAEE